LAIEKQMKAVVVARTGEIPPKSHDLLRLAALAGCRSTTRSGRCCLE
jgi:hypothetical protein